MRPPLPTRRPARRGFSLIELLVSMVLLGIFAGAVSRVVSSQTRFFDSQSANKGARRAARGALNLIVADLRMVDAATGVVAASPTAVTVSVPYAMGIRCQLSPQVVSFLPGQPSLDPNPTFAAGKGGPFGYAWRDSASGAYQYVETGGVTVARADGFSATSCTAAQITSLAAPGGATDVRLVSPAPVASGALVPRVGDPVILYQRIRYHFAPSVTAPGSTALWRTVVRPSGGEAADELAAPFEESAKFAYFVGAANTITASPTAAQLPQIRGLSLVLDGRSERATLRTGKPATFTATSAVFFQNR